MSMTDQERARSLLNAAKIFATGCSNTQVPPSPPEDCEECRAAFLRACERITRGEGPEVPAP